MQKSTKNEPSHDSYILMQEYYRTTKIQNNRTLRIILDITYWRDKFLINNSNENIFIFICYLNTRETSSSSFGTSNSFESLLCCGQLFVCVRYLLHNLSVLVVFRTTKSKITYFKKSHLLFTIPNDNRHEQNAHHNLLYNPQQNMQ